MNPIELAYCAGIIDGEGYIGISKNKDNNYTYHIKYEYAIQVMMTDKPPIEFLAKTFNGKIVTFTKRRKHPLHSVTFRGRAAERVLNIILPYLVGKRNQASTVLKFCDLRKRWKDYRCVKPSERVASGQIVPRMAISPKYLNLCEFYYQQCKNYKTRNQKTNQRLFNV